MGGSSEAKAYFTKLGDVSDLQQFNPYTGNMWDFMSGNIENLQGGRAGQGIGLGNILARQQGAAGMSTDIASQLMGDYGAGAMANRDALMQEAMSAVSGQFANQDALNTGAALSAMTRGAAAPAAQYGMGMAQMQSGLAQQLMGGALGAETQGLANLYNIMGQFAMPTYFQPTYAQSGTKEGSWGF